MSTVGMPRWVRRFCRQHARALSRLGADLTRRYGCGANGCAFPTRGGRWTVKVTADPSEVGIVRAVERWRAAGAPMRGLVRVKRVASGKEALGSPKVWVIVRETFRPVRLSTSTSLSAAVRRLEDAAWIARYRNQAADAGHPTGDLERRYLEAVRTASSGPGRDVAAAMLSLARRGVYLEDVRRDNLGLVRRGSRTVLAITDPGGNLAYPSFSSVPRLNPRRNPPMGKRAFEHDMGPRAGTDYVYFARRRSRQGRGPGAWYDGVQIIKEVLGVSRRTGRWVVRHGNTAGHGPWKESERTFEVEWKEPYVWIAKATVTDLSDVRATPRDNPPRRRRRNPDRDDVRLSGLEPQEILKELRLAGVKGGRLIRSDEPDLEDDSIEYTDSVGIQLCTGGGFGIYGCAVTRSVGKGDDWGQYHWPDRRHLGELVRDLRQALAGKLPPGAAPDPRDA